MICCSFSPLIVDFKVSQGSILDVDFELEMHNSFINNCLKYILNFSLTDLCVCVGFLGVGFPVETFSSLSGLQGNDYAL